MQRGAGTYSLAPSPFITPVDHWTVCGLTYSLQDGRLAGVRSSNDEDSKLDIVEVLDAHRRFGRDLTHSLITMMLRGETCRGTEHV